MAAFKKIGTLLTCSALSVGMLASVASASAVDGPLPMAKIQFASEDKDTAVTKKELIQKFRALFPDQFQTIKDHDFQMSGGHIYPGDDRIRYNLSFSKTVNGKPLYGDIGFIGENLEVENFSYQPPSFADSLFPAKVSKEQAKKRAAGFLEKFTDGKTYQLEGDSYHFYPQRILTEPVRYSFSFSRMHQKVAVADQRGEIVVLGNGEIVGFYMPPVEMTDSFTFDNTNQAIDKSEISKKMKENVSVELKYLINNDYFTGKRDVQLAYQPIVHNVHALTGKWEMANGYADAPVKRAKIEKLVSAPLPPKQKGLTAAEAQQFAETFLASQSDKVTLHIQGVDEYTNQHGKEVYLVQYMYEFANGGQGTSLEIDKQTGDIIQYYDMWNDISGQIGEEPPKGEPVSQQKALSSAVAYLKELAPSNLHHYAMPLEEPYAAGEQRSFIFPRIVNGIPVVGDEIGVSVASDGSLVSLNVNHQNIDHWPSADQVISADKAMNIYREALDVKQNYTRNGEAEHYDLVYVPVFDGKYASPLHANTGEWMTGDSKSITIAHPWAAEELSRLVNTNVLTVKNPNHFNGDAVISQGEALKVILNALTYFYEDGFGTQDNHNQTFENIKPDHPLYRVVERAVEMGIISDDKPSFNADAPITREELAVWYVRILGLEKAAKQSNIYKLNLEDADQVQTKYAGYVALANSMGLLQAEKNYFHPGKEVSYAELAVSLVRLAHELAERDRGIFNY